MHFSKHVILAQVSFSVVRVGPGLGRVEPSGGEMGHVLSYPYFITVTLFSNVRLSDSCSLVELQLS